MSIGAKWYAAFFAVLAIVLIILIVWASLEKHVLEIFKVMLAERWGIVTLIDLYGGFVVTATWICVLERRAWRAVPWLVAMFFLGNLATAIYVVFRAWRARSIRDIFIGAPQEPGR
ncbi:MAG: hypothetical protein GIKADHBN_02875 [Phycisphaerales bacterium]|nr:hypothetical protein [Phycisphaerales bacterium]